MGRKVMAGREREREAGSGEKQEEKRGEQANRGKKAGEGQSLRPAIPRRRRAAPRVTACR